MWWVLSLACTGDPLTDPFTPDFGVPWSRRLPALGDGPRGRIERRAIVHLHSPWSHDACDGDPQPDGAANEPCLVDLRAGLCDTRIDAAFLTDHPAEAAFQPYEDLFHPRDGDEWVEVDGVRVANRIVCDDGHEVTWMPGIEDELMPLSLDRQVAGDDLAENDRLYNSSDDEAVAAEIAAGAAVFVAHTEQRPLAELERLQDAGLAGVEVFNLHAMFAPDIRSEALGLDALGWVEDIAPFTSPDTAGEPDLMMLGVLQAQGPSLASWDALLARGPTAGVAGTDAHQNVLPILLRDGERGDSYRRMMRWFSNVLLADDVGPSELQAAVAGGRSYVVFEVLGTPVGFDFALEADQVYEMGASSASEGTLRIGCPTLHPDSPRGTDEAEIRVQVLKDGQPWHEGCGEVPTDGPGVYRVEVTVVPHHLRPFLGEEPEVWIREFPWIYGNAIRVGLQ